MMVRMAMDGGDDGVSGGNDECNDGDSTECNV